MKGKKIALIVLAAAIALAAALGAVGGVLFAKTPSNAVIGAKEGTITRVARSYRDDSWYYGDSAGNFVKMNGAGEETASFTLPSGASVRSIVSHPLLSDVYLLDGDNHFYRIADEGETLNCERIRSFEGGYQTMTTDGEYLYFAAAMGRYTQFLKYDIDDIAGEPAATGHMYTCLNEGENYKFTLVSSGNIVGMFADENYVYVITGEGQNHRMDKDFSMNSQERLIALGATSQGGSLLLPGERYDAEKYMTTGLTEQIRARSAAFDSENGRFYVASSEGTFATLDLNLQVVTERNRQLPSTPASGAMAFHPESGTVYIAYDNVSTVSAFDAESGNLRYQAETAFYISGMVVPAHGDRLLVICSGNDKDNPDYKELLSVDVGTLGNRDALTAGGTALIVLAAVFLIVALFAALCAFRKNFIVKFRKTVLGMLRNWVTYLIILGSLALLILFCYYPGISSMVLSFFDYTRENPTMHFNNFENYIKIFTNEANLIAFRNMLVFLLADIVTALLPPIIFALCLAFMRSKRYSTFARVMLFLPTVLPGIANLLIWKDGIYGAEGVLNLLIRVLSGQSVEEYVPILFLQDHAMPSLIMMGFPFVGSYLVFYGALMNVPSSYYEAAELDGCPLFKRLGMIDLPMISSQIKYVFVLSFIQSVQNFGRVLMTTGGSITTGTQIPILLMYNNLMDGNYGLSSAYATLMFLILIVVTVLNMKIQTEDWEV